MNTPQRGDIWCFAARENYHYLILNVVQAKDTYNDSDIIIADLLRLDDGQYFFQYEWPDHTWKKVA